jgi:hypothetical protein
MVIANKGYRRKEVNMPFGIGFGRGFGRGFGGWAYGPYGYGAYPVRGWGRGRGNPFSFCRNFPWLPRWWWAAPNAAQYGATIPYYGYGGYFPASYEPYSTAQIKPEQELDMLKGQAEMLEDELDGIKKRIKELEKPNV